MDNYYKYKIYKEKYLTLKNMLDNIQTGGSNIIFNLDKYKPLFHRFINELKHEMSFSLDYDPKTNDLISQFIKGNEIISPTGNIDMKTDIFNEKLCFTHINCHTHDKFSARKLYPQWCPPSSNDLIAIIISYYKYNTNLNLVFAPEGIYEISLGQKLLNEINQEKYAVVKNYFIPSSRQLDFYHTSKEWEELKERIELDTNAAQILFSKPFQVSSDLYKKIQRKYNNININSIEDYLKFIRNIGFNIEFHKWDEPLNIKLTIPTHVHQFLNATIQAKQQGFLLDILLFNADNYRQQDIIHLIKELNKNNYVILNNKTIDEIFMHATTQPVGAPKPKIPPPVAPKPKIPPPVAPKPKIPPPVAPKPKIPPPVAPRPYRN